MGHTVTFYAMDGQAFARAMGESAAETLEKVEHLFRRHSPDDDETWNILRPRMRRICDDDLPTDCDGAYFFALGWLAAVAGEELQICGFEGFRRLSFLDDLAIWPEFQRHAAPFPLPRSSDDTFSAGYMSVDSIRVFTQDTLTDLPPSTDRDVVNLRDDFHYTLTTLLDDNLDLLAVLTDA